MTKAEIVQTGKHYLNESNVNHSEFRIKLYLEFFGKEQEVFFANLPSLTSEPEMTILADIVNELLNFDIANKEWLKNEVWKHYEISVENTSYGMVPEEGFRNESDANRAYFKIFNKEDAFKAIELVQIWTDLKFTKVNYFNLSIECPWEDEHGISIGVKNGKFDSIY